MAIDCQCISTDGCCLHHLAPTSIFKRTKCILQNPPKDPRIRDCALQYPYKTKDGHPLPPPIRIIKEFEYIGKRKPIYDVYLIEGRLMKVEK
jgi:hypothetical protein